MKNNIDIALHDITASESTDTYIATIYNREPHTHAHKYTPYDES